MTRFIQVNCAVYRAFLAAYPPTLRDRFEIEMIDVFAEDLLDEWRGRGGAGIARVWWRAVVEVLRVAVPQRVTTPPLAGPLVSLAIHITIGGIVIAIGTAFHEGIPQAVVHGLVSLHLHP